MVVGQVVAASGGNGLKLKIGKSLFEMTARSAESTVKFVVGIIHLIDLEDGFQAVFVKGFVVGDKGKVFPSKLLSLFGRKAEQRFDFFPYVGEDGRVCGVFRR